MMNCEKYIPLIQDYADDELNYKNNQIIESHLKNCTLCRKRLEQTHTIKRFIGAKLQIPSAPSYLVKTIHRDIRTNANKKKQKRMLVLVSIFAFLLVILPLCLYNIYISTIPSVLIEQLISDHMNSLTKEIPWQITTQEQKKLEDWLNEKLHSQIALPKFEKPHFRLEGGGLCHVYNQHIAIAFYRLEDKELLSLFVFDAKDLPSFLNTICQKQDANKYSILYWKNKEHVYLLVMEKKTKSIEKVEKILAEK